MLQVGVAPTARLAPTQVIVPSGTSVTVNGLVSVTLPVFCSVYVYVIVWPAALYVVRLGVLVTVMAAAWTGVTLTVTVVELTCVAP